MSYVFAASCWTQFGVSVLNDYYASHRASRFLYLNNLLLCRDDVKNLESLDSCTLGMLVTRKQHLSQVNMSMFIFCCESLAFLRKWHTNCSS